MHVNGKAIQSAQELFQSSRSDGPNFPAFWATMSELLLLPIEKVLNLLPKIWWKMFQTDTVPCLLFEKSWHLARQSAVAYKPPELHLRLTLNVQAPSFANSGNEPLVC